MLTTLETELLEALKAAQFGPTGHCPVCDGFNMSDAGATRRVHTKKCIVAKAIQRVEAKAVKE